MAKPVLVAGATGGIGRLVVQKLLAQGTPVRVLARDFQAARTLFSDTVEYIAGDTRQLDTLHPAVMSVQAVICTIGAGQGADTTNTPETVDYEGVRNLVEAAKTAEVEHFILVSSLGATQPDHMLNRMFNNILNWKLKGEDALRASGLPYTIIRPGGLIDEPGSQQMLRVSQGDSPEFSGRISREDVAEICVRALEQPDARNVTFEVINAGGPPLSDWAVMFGGLKPDKT
jgi:uncharacterized protein YbjT (DUF2867 family)